MSLIKWTLAMAGTAIGLRYLSERNRKRLAAGGGTTSSSPKATTPWRTDRDSSPAGDAWSSTKRDDASRMSTPTAGRTDDLLSPDSDVPPSQSTPRY